VPGYFTADPHRRSDARPIHDLDFDEALRMADAGCDLVQRAALAAAAVLTATTSGGGVLATLHLQDVLGLDPARGGMLLAVAPGAVVAGSAAGARARAPAAVLIAGGMGDDSDNTDVAAVSVSATAFEVAEDTHPLPA